MTSFMGSFSVSSFISSPSSVERFVRIGTKRKGPHSSAKWRRTKLQIQTASFPAISWQQFRIDLHGLACVWWQLGQEYPAFLSVLGEWVELGGDFGEEFGYHGTKMTRTEIKISMQSRYNRHCQTLSDLGSVVHYQFSFTQAINDKILLSHASRCISLQSAICGPMMVAALFFDDSIPGPNLLPTLTFIHFMWTNCSTLPTDLKFSQRRNELTGGRFRGIRDLSIHLDRHTDPTGKISPYRPFPHCCMNELPR